MKVLSTYRILKQKALDEPIDESWIDWAIEMIEAGYESQYLYQLAGEMKPYNQFMLKDLTDNVLQDLKLDYSNKDQVIQDYIYYLLSSSIDYPEKYGKVLSELRHLTFQDDYEDRYMDFYYLYWAMGDLDYSEEQYYWPGATKENINQVIKEEFQKWINTYQKDATCRNNT